jgi:hypothetical protein
MGGEDTTSVGKLIVDLDEAQLMTNDVAPKSISSSSSSDNRPQNNTQEQSAGGMVGISPYGIPVHPTIARDMRKKAELEIKEKKDQGRAEAKKNRVNLSKRSGTDSRNVLAEKALPLILASTIQELSKDTRKISNSFTDQIEGIATVEKDGTVRRELEVSPVILKLPASVMEFADSVSERNKACSLTQGEQNAISSEVMDFLECSEDENNLASVDQGFVTEVKEASKVRFKIPEKIDSIFHNPKIKKEPLECPTTVLCHTEAGESTGAFGHTEVSQVEYGHTEAEYGSYGHDSSASGQSE